MSGGFFREKQEQHTIS